MKKVIAIATSAALLASLSSQAGYAFASEASKVNVVSAAAQSKAELGSTATVVPFALYGKDILNAYDQVYKMNPANIKSITNNGGNYPNSAIGKAIDGDVNTHWETGKPNTSTFKNEVVFLFKEATELNRIVYIARQTGAKGKGFAQQFDIYGSTTDTGDDFALVSSGEYTGSTGDVVEIEFTPAVFKRLKFVYRKANQDWASAAEFSFYKEDAGSAKMKSLFTDDTLSQVSNEFNTLDKLTALENEVQSHPLYAQFKEDIENAKILLENHQTEATIAKVSKLKGYGTEYESAYSEAYRMPNSNISKVTVNGGSYPGTKPEYMLDDLPNTHWETSKNNDASFTNEVVFELAQAEVLDRVAFLARDNRKGFPEAFEIYASETSKGETFQLVSSGTATSTNDFLEFKFEPTKFKRLKFKFTKANINRPFVAEFRFYTEDKISEAVDGLFTDGTMSAVIPAYNSVDKINELEAAAKIHPLYPILKETLDLAKKLVTGEIQVEGTIIQAEQRGDMKKHAQQNLRIGFGTNNQPTGLVAMPGDTIHVYVDAESTDKLPSLIISQQEGSWNSWAKSVQLRPGKNTITVPEFATNSNYAHAVTKGGTVYIVNPYTAAEQGKAPLIRFEGLEKIPMMTKTTDPEQFKAFLTTYKQRLDEDKAVHPNVEDRELIDVVEMVSDHVIFTGTATEAYNKFISQGNNPLDTITGYDTWMKTIFDFYGLDGSSELHDAKLIRENIRLMQPYGAMYAAGDHTGIQLGTVGTMLSDFNKVYPGWGLNHEIGHRLAMGEREYGEVTNNMVSMLMSVAANSIDNRIPYETDIYKYVLEENKVVMNQQGLFAQLGAYWQLEMAHPGYWTELTKLYRERKVTLTNGDNSKQQYLVEFSSEVLGLDLSSYFARHGFTVNPETREKLAKYPAPQKLWYLNNSVIHYEGTGIENKDVAIKVNITPNTTAKSNALSFSIDKNLKQDFLGYEVYRDDVLVGFTGTDQFVDKSVDSSINYTYKIIGYDKKLNPLKSVEVKAFKPALSAEDQITLKLNQTFDPMSYVKAVDYKGNDITADVTLKSSTVDVTQKGNYEMVYELTNEGATETKTTQVTVTSDYAYVSDLNAKSAVVGWGDFKKDKAVSGGIITLLRQGIAATYTKGLGVHANSEVVYDIAGKGYDFFESYIGIDQAMKGKPSSATFEVYVDGEKKFESGVLRAGTEHEYVKIPVAGAQQVKLVTTDAGDGNASDHTLWADAKFLIQSSAPALTIPKSVSTKVGQPIAVDESYSAIDAEDGDLTTEVKVNGHDEIKFNRPGEYPITYTVTDSDGNTTTKTRTIAVVNMEDFTYLTDYDWKSTQNSYTAPLKDKSISAKALRLTDENNQVVSYERGIGAHSNSTIIYDLSDKNADYFTSYVGVDRQMYGSVGSISFEVFVDGEKKFDSGLMNSRDPQKYIEVDINGAKELKLVVTDGGNGNGSDHATWGGTKLHFANGDHLFTADLEQAIEAAKAISLESFTAESIAAFTTSLSAAESAVANPSVTQSEVDAALAALQQAIEGLVEVDLTQVITVEDKYLSASIKNTLGVTGELTLGDMYNLTILTSETRRARSLEGLQYAKNLETLDITGNEITDFSPLQGLTKLTSLLADPQMVEVGQLDGSVVEVTNLVKGLDGSPVIPSSAGVRNTKTYKEIMFDMNEWAANPDVFTIDLSNEDKGIYMLYLSYQVEGNLVQLIYVINNK